MFYVRTVVMVVNESRKSTLLSYVGPYNSTLKVVVVRVPRLPHLDVEVRVDRSTANTIVVSMVSGGNFVVVMQT